VWEHEPGFGHHNTILVDNEEHKFADWSDIGIVVPEYTADDVVNETPRTLAAAEQYLLTMSREFGTPGFDVRVFMKENPPPHPEDEGYNAGQGEEGNAEVRRGFVIGR
jgi:hypothetical protein